MSTLELRHAGTDEEVAACFPLMQQLRPHLAGGAELLARVRRQEKESYRLLAAWRDGHPVGAAGYRFQENLVRGRFVYVDDLVVLDSERRSGIGALLLDEVSRIAKGAGYDWLTLDTALNNSLGQRFYFRWGMLSTALHFGKPLR